jgi:hypothetical protein
MWCYACIWHILTLNSGADSHFCHSAYVSWSDVELWSAHVPARLSNFCCRTYFVRRDVHVECSSTLLPVVSRNGGNAYWKLRQRNFLYDTKSPDYRNQNMRANAWEEIGKKLKIKCKILREDSVSPALPSDHILHEDVWIMYKELYFAW